MKVYLDDIRPCPSGWVLAKNYFECIELIKSGEVTHLSLDHDLGDEEMCGSGYGVVCWLELQVASNARFSLPVLEVHSANPVGRAKMLAGIESIKKLQDKRKNKYD